jgi:ABC-type antimicrobial peptide transport system permease subunit
VREPARPAIYLPIEKRNGGSLLVRTTGDPLAISPALRREIPRARPEFRVRRIGMQSALVARQMIRERLLAALSLFFAAVAMVLAGIGLYGVLNDRAIRERREIGIRMALGAGFAHLLRGVAARMFGNAGAGAALGLAAGLASARFIESLLFEVQASDLTMILTPLLALMGVAIVAALPPSIRILRIDPAETLRSE